MIGIINAVRNGLQWKDAPKHYGHQNTLCNRFIQWRWLAVFDRMFASLVGEGPRPERIMIDAPHLKAHWIAVSLLKKGMFPRRIGRTKGGLSSKLHFVCDGDGRPLALPLSKGQLSDHTGEKLLYPSLPIADTLIPHKRYDSDELREALGPRNIEAYITPKHNRKVQHAFDRQLYKAHHKIENMFGRLKDRRRISTRYYRCAHTFLSAFSVAATCVLFLNQ